MNRAALTSSLVLAGLITSAGCKTEGPPSSSPPPSTQPVALVPSSGNAASPPPPVVTPTVMLPDKDMTHKVSADTPYFMSMPAAGQKPDGMMKAGSKCLVMLPGATYSKVTTQSGLNVYAPTENLDPLGK